MEQPHHPYCVVLLAAGSGARFGGTIPKQWTRLGTKLVLAHSLDTFTQDPRCERIVLVVAQDKLTDAEGVASQKTMVVAGDDTREGSTAAGLAALAALPGDHQPYVLIHDAARPLVPSDVIDRLLDACINGASAAVPAVPVTDTLKDAASGKTVDRDLLRRAQTPQAFRFDDILGAHTQRLTGTDDASLMEQAGHQITLVAGDVRLHKLTTSDDRQILEGFMMLTTSIRMGFGFDVHAFMAQDNVALDNGDIAHRKELVLGGISIPATVEGARPLAGHSDADVVLHSITDAILGAIADNDIGHHFPPSDPQWRGASSDQFLAYAAGPRLARKRGELVNVDATIICERPKIGPFRDAMRARIADICGIDIDCISIKASTTERLGFTGRGEGIACQAVVTVKVDQHA